MVIDQSMFSMKALIDAMINDRFGTVGAWIALVEIVPNYMPPFPRADTRPICVVRFKNSFLRYSCGPLQGYFWDVYSEDFIRPELALLAVVQAPVPPGAISSEVWSDIAAAKKAKERTRE